jgi:hypothetical protein
MKLAPLIDTVPGRWAMAVAVTFNMIGIPMGVATYGQKQYIDNLIYSQSLPFSRFDVQTQHAKFILKIL